MREVHHALRPEGLFIVTVPQHPWMWSRLDDIVHHKRRYTRAELTRGLLAAGYDVLYTTSFVTILFPFMMASRFAARLRAGKGDTRQDFADQVTLAGPLNRVFDWAMRVDESVLRLGVSLPFGGSLLAVARRRAV